MSDTENLDYLQRDFDPWTLTIPRLRSILVTYNVNYPATAKKPQLIDLFNEHVVPQSKKILAQRARAKRSSMGIVDAQSSASQSTVDLDDHDLMPPPRSAQRTRSPRKSRVKQESEEPDFEPELRSPRKRQQRSTSRQTSTMSESDTGTDADGVAAPKSVRRARTKTPQIKLEEAVQEEEGTPRPVSRTVSRPVSRPMSSGDENIFTSDNPFQSGGSSPPAPAVKTPSGRRKTTGMEIAKRTASSAARRRTDGPVTSDSGSKFSASFDIPISTLNGARISSQPTLDPGEEFTPEEQLELAQHEAIAGTRAVATRARQSGGLSLTTPIFVLMITLLGAYAGLYRQEKMAVGYCGVGRPPKSIIPEFEWPGRLKDLELPPWLKDVEVPAFIKDIEIPGWANTLMEPQCEPCPPHAYCYEDFSVRCENDYILKPHPFSLGGIVPLPPTCEPDGEKVRRVKVVADKAVEELRDRRAKWECGELIDEEGQVPETPAIEEQVLKEVVSEKRSKRLNKEEFDDLWLAALGEIKSRDEVEVEVQQTTSPGALPNTQLSSTSLARLPLACALRRSLRLGLARYRLHVCALVAAALSAWYTRARLRARASLKARVPVLVDLVLERLASQKELAYEDAAGGGDDAADSFLFLPHLRDDVLRAEHSLAARERTWAAVRAVVEQNSNVRTGQREGGNGEVGRAWEWVGPGGGEVGSATARRRRSGRVSWGPDVKGTTPEEEGGATPGLEMAENRAGLHRKWQESRPIY